MHFELVGRIKWFRRCRTCNSGAFTLKFKLSSITYARVYCQASAYSSSWVRYATDQHRVSGAEISFC